MSSPLPLLKDIAKQTNTRLSTICTRYAMERFLYRWGLSPHANSFFLKGGMLMLGLRAPSARPTQDIDLLGKISNSAESVKKVITDILLTKPQIQDGVNFNTALHLQEITKDARYVGTRVSFNANVQGELVQLKIDIGFSDSIYPHPIILEYPTLLDKMPPAKVQCYSRESVIAEKWQATVQLGSFNSRMKDFYDLWLLSQTSTFDFATLQEAIRQTFERRSTEWHAYRNLQSERYCIIQQKLWAPILL